MKLYRRVALILVAAVAAGALVFDVGVRGQEAGRSAPFDYQAWDQYSGGSDSSQYSALDQINTSNVDQLEVAWTFPTGAGGNYSFSPIVVDGVMYVAAQNSSIVALDAGTGRNLWIHENDGRIGARGLNYWQNESGTDRRLLYLVNGFLTAIDAETGHTITSFGENGMVDFRTAFPNADELRPLMTSNPGRIFEDLMIVSMPALGASYNANPADVHAYDVRTGDRRWVFHTLAGPGEFGADTWPQPMLRQIGGGHNWSEFSIDEERGIAYIPTGTARFDFYGGNRHGNNLFANSLVALDARTGQRLWHFQTVHHDLWDYDLPNAPKLLTIRRDGREIDAVAQVTKHGFVFVFDRVTGEPVWPIEERPVPQSDVPGEQSSPTQPFPTAPPPFARQSFTEADINPFLPEAEQAELREQMKGYRNEGLFTPPSLQGSISLPGHNGGANWGSSAVDPARGRLYVVSKELPTLLRLVAPGEGGRGGRGRGRGGPPEVPPNANPDFIAYSSPYDFMQMSNGLSAIGPPWSRLTAYDLNEGTIMWQIPDGELPGLEGDTGSHAPRGGPVVTAGGLVFVGTSSDRTLRAYDADTGRVLWERKLGSAIEGVPAVYEVDGREYLVVCVAGGTGLFAPRVGDQSEPEPGQYMVFALPRS